MDVCLDCGLCCKKLIVEIEHLDVVREPRLLNKATLMDGNGSITFNSDWEKSYLLACGEPCPFLDGITRFRCGIYPTRPNTCVGFEVGSVQCNELRVQHGLDEVHFV
jgi:Fe-S-cluster containining protein